MAQTEHGTPSRVFADTTAAAAAAVAAADRLSRRPHAEFRFVLGFGRRGTVDRLRRSAVLRTRRPHAGERLDVRDARAAVRQHAEPDVVGKGRRRPILRDRRARRRRLGRAQVDRGSRGHHARRAGRARPVHAVCPRHWRRRRPADHSDVGEPIGSERHRRRYRVPKIVRRPAAARRRPGADQRTQRNRLAVVVRKGVLLLHDLLCVLDGRHGRHLLSVHVPPGQRPGPDDHQGFPARQRDERVPEVGRPEPFLRQQQPVQQPKIPGPRFWPGQDQRPARMCRGTRRPQATGPAAERRTGRNVRTRVQGRVRDGRRPGRRGVRQDGYRPGECRTDIRAVARGPEHVRAQS